jgi:hypothetical protein
MFTTDITLAGDSSSTRTYSLTSISGGSAVRANASVAAGEAEVMTISHGLKSKSPGSPERHLVRLDLTKVNATTGIPATGSVYLVIEEPVATITPAQLQDMCTQLKNFLTAGNITKLFNGEP